MDELCLDETAEGMRILHTKAYKSRSHISKREICVVYPDFVFTDKLSQRAYLSSFCFGSNRS